MTDKLSAPPSRAWVKATAPYQNPEVIASLRQLGVSLGAYAVLWLAAVLAWNAGWWPLSLLLALPAGGFLVRLFIVFHDCTHSSFFKHQRWNDIVGIPLGVLTFTPYYSWRRSHAIHHATSGDLDRRGIGDVETKTVREYMADPWPERLRYRLLRHPIVLFVIGAPFLFLFINRVPLKSDPPREAFGVHATTAAILGMAALMSALIGWQAYLAIQLTVLVFASIVGVWMFYVQHQFEETYWKPHEDWDYFQAAVLGSSYYQLPPVLNWITGNIGYHHIHHLSPKIPNYELARCYAENEAFQNCNTLSLSDSFKTLGWRLWDEDAQRMVGFARVRELRREARRAGAAA